MKYELSDDQVKQLLAIIASAQIRGNDAPVIIQLVQALQKPIVENVPETKTE